MHYIDQSNDTQSDKKSFSNQIFVYEIIIHGLRAKDNINNAISNGREEKKINHISIHITE